MLQFVSRATGQAGYGDADTHELIARARGDAAAFDALYQRYLPPVYRYLLSLTGNPEDAADLTQHAFTRAFERIGRYQDSGSFSAWLLQIARNAAIDAYRRRRFVVSWERLPLCAQPTYDQKLEEMAVRNEELASLSLLLARLPVDKRDLVALRFGGGLTCAEIGLIVGKREAAVKKALQRTLRRLKEAYDAQC